jgi:hypothetical protein
MESGVMSRDFSVEVGMTAAKGDFLYSHKGSVQAAGAETKSRITERARELGKGSPPPNSPGRPRRI